MGLEDALERFKKGDASIDDVKKELRLDYFARVGDAAKLDVARVERVGVPEMVYAEFKTPVQVRDIVVRMLQDGRRAIVTKLDSGKHSELRIEAETRFHEEAGIAIYHLPGSTVKSTGGVVGIMSGGTSDLPYAEEARIIAEEMGCRVHSTHDVGIAALHRTLDAVKEMMEKDVDAIIVVAGMEGTLPSVVGALVPVPVIGLPTHIGYGVGKDGQAALSAMLSSCSPGITVVNIDNGVGAGIAAALMANRAASYRK
jgi:NCAIR mutase (PurE)-related protein